MSTEIDELKQARYRSDKTISGHNAFLRPPTGETNSVDTRGFYFVLKEPHPLNFGQNFRTVWRNSNGVLKMRGGSSIGGHNGPTVFEDFHLVGSQIDHRLDSKDKPRSDFWAFAVLDVVQNGRIFVKRAADAVPAKFTNDSIVVRIR